MVLNGMRIGMALLLGGITTMATAGDVAILDAKATQAGSTWRFDVTVAHEDTGWDHYADGWEVVDEQGNRLGYRKLLHPHVNEQPFTRSLSGVALPVGTDRVFVRAHDSVHGWSDAVFEVRLD